jgi:hypothetical protein
MYISPFIVLALLPAPDAPGEADFPAAGLGVERIGGTSTCWIPFFAWIWALILAAAAARIYVSLIHRLRNSLSLGTYLLQRQDQHHLSLRRLEPELGYQMLLQQDFCCVWTRWWSSVLGESANACQILRLSLARAQSGQSASALRCVAQCRPS